MFDTADDVYFTVTPSYTIDAITVTLNITGAKSSAGVALPFGGLLPAGNYRLTIFSSAAGTSIHDLSGLKLDGDANGTEGGNYVRVFSVYSTVSSRELFYNNSSFDGKDPAANASDDAAIAQNPDGSAKQALLPGQTASFANYTSYNKGINGVMIDVAGLPWA